VAVEEVALAEVVVELGEADVVVVAAIAAAVKPKKDVEFTHALLCSLNKATGS